jgi:hypothetical protein
LRPAVIWRKAANGYRAMGAADYEMAALSAADAARLASADTFQTTLKNHQLMTPPGKPGNKRRGQLRRNYMQWNGNSRISRRTST